MSTPTVAIADIRSIVNRLLDRIEASGTHSITLKDSFYWDVPEEGRYDIDSPPKEPDIRSLHDDWDCVRFMLDAGEDPIVDQLYELSPLLRYIADNLRD